MTVQTIRMRWPEWSWQLMAYDQLLLGPLIPYEKRSVHRYVWVVCRQIGKTSLIRSLLIAVALEQPDIYWYIAPSYERAEEVWNLVKASIHPLIQRGLARSRATAAGWEITFNNGARLEFKSTGNIEARRGATLGGLCVDEFGQIKGYYWREILEPMLLARKGWAVLLGTPPDPYKVPDPDFAVTVWQHAVGSQDWRTLNFTYMAHPDADFRRYVEDEIQPRMPRDEFEREYLAKFPDRVDYHMPPPTILDVLDTETSQGLYVATTIDLADNEREYGDKAAVVTTGIGGQGLFYVLHAEYARNPSEVLDKAYQHRHTYQSRWLGIQKTSYDSGFRYTVEEAEKHRGPLPVRMLTVGGTSKARRISQLEPIARAGRLIVLSHNRDWLNEWDEYTPERLIRDTRSDPTAHHFDMLDATAGRIEDLWHPEKWQKREKSGMNTMDAAIRAAKLRNRGRRVEDIFRP